MLVELQELDTRLAQLSHRSETLPEHRQIVELRAEDARLGEQLAKITSETEVLRQAQRDREAEVQGLEDILRRQAVVEDQIIELMEQIEPFALEEAEIEGKRTLGGETLRELDQLLAATQTEIEGERRAVNKERAEVEERGGVDLVALYDRNRDRMGDHTAGGRLVGTSCGACFLGISAVEIDRIRRLPSNEPSECPECGALLIR